MRVTQAYRILDESLVSGKYQQAVYCEPENEEGTGLEVLICIIINDYKYCGELIHTVKQLQSQLHKQNH